MRLFVAIRPPKPVREQLLRIMNGVRNARWQDDGQLHLTLRFIGEVDQHRGEDIAAILGTMRVPKFAIQIDGVGAFERKGRPTALWAGLAPSKPLVSLQKTIESAIRQIGLEPETRNYLPHITIARLNNSAGPTHNFLADNAALTSPAFAIEHFDLMESILGRNGAYYESVARFWLD